MEILLRCLRAVESERGTTFPLVTQQNKGEFFPKGMALYIACRAAMGHNGEDPREGMVIVVKFFLF